MRVPVKISIFFEKKNKKKIGIPEKKSKKLKKSATVSKFFQIF